MKVVLLAKALKDTKKSELLGRLGAYAQEGNDLYLEGTQANIPRKVQQWIDNPNSKPISWLHRMAGTGKYM